MVADLAALRAAGRGLGSRLGMEKAGLKIGLLRVEQGALESTLVGKAAGAFTLGAVYEGIFRPVHSGEEHEFWSARFKNGLAGGATLASLDLSLRALNPLASKAISNEANFALRSARNLAVGSVAGFGAGVTNAAVRSALSDWEFRTSDLLTSGAQYAVAGSVFRTPFLLNPVQKTSLNPERELRATMETDKCLRPLCRLLVENAYAHSGSSRDKGNGRWDQATSQQPPVAQEPDCIR